MKDLKSLRFSPSDVRNFRSLCDELDVLQKKCKDTLWNNMRPDLPSTVIDNMDALHFEEELTDSSIDRATKGGILCDDMQRFLRFKTAMTLVSKSTSVSEKVEELSDDLEKSLFSFTGLMRKVLRENDIPLPLPEELNDLGDRLDEKTKFFLEFLEEVATENTDGKKIKESTVDDVRNYVILRTFSEALLLFKIDLGYLIE